MLKFWHNGITKVSLSSNLVWLVAIDFIVLFRTLLRTTVTHRSFLIIVITDSIIFIDRISPCFSCLFVICLSVDLLSFICDATMTQISLKYFKYHSSLPIICSRRLQSLLLGAYNYTSISTAKGTSNCGTNSQSFQCAKSTFVLYNYMGIF